VVATLALLWLGPSALPAQAASETTNCSGLQAALDQATNGDTITLNQLCTGQDFALNNGAHDSRSYTLQGQSGSGAGFDGTGATTSMLHANNSSGDPTSTMTVRNLVFRNAPAAPLRNGGALVFQGEYSVVLDGNTFTDNQVDSGFGGAVDVETLASSASVTLTNNTFTDNQAINGGSGGAVNLATQGASADLTLTNDTFTQNQTVGGGNGGAVELSAFSPTQSLTVGNSTFRGNVTNGSGGGLDVFAVGSPLPVTLTGNTFANNQVNGCGAPCELDGAGVAIVSFAAPAQVTQSGNAFTGNTITGGVEDVAGGGETIIGQTLASTGDVFTGNSIQAPVSGQSSLGAGLSIQNNCTAASPQHVLTNLAVAGNTITDGGDTSGADGAVAMSCEAGTGTSPSNGLLLRNSTISGNRGGGGTGGVWGASPDQLTAQNSIVNGNSDGAELTGFNGAGGSVTATFSDLCSGASPFPGTGNICAEPLLAGAGSGDVHQTASSPTIDVGSNALVPGGLATDVYGVQRIQPRVKGGPPIVDMGAAEFPSVPASPAIATSASAGVVLGGSVNDTASLSGGDGPTGQITFSLYDRSDETCSEAPIFTDDQTVSGAGTYQSADFTPTGIGTYRWIAVYSGDANNNPASTACNDSGESVTVTAPLVTELKLDPDTFAASNKDTPLGPPSPKGVLGTPVGSHVSLALDAPTLVHFFVRRKGAPPPSPHRHRHGFNRNLKAGENTFAFTGKLYGKKLRPGKYTLFARPVSSSSGRRFKRVSAPFTIVGG
jgi:hypothetical protein